jgi:CubicO group peptidase (beta-lactamase class C family)
MQTRSFHSAWFLSDGASGSSGAASSVFPWWSFTKTAIAICALRLVEDGQLELDALRPHRPYTLRQLLQHRAGVPNYGALKAYHEAVARGDVPWSRERLLKAVAADRLDFPPGKGWAYSNVGYLFVRDAIEEAAGVSLRVALQELVLAPLQVPSVRLAETSSDFAEVFWPPVRAYDPRWVYHGCLVGTPIDAGKVLHGLLTGGILKPATLRVMTEDHELGGALAGRPWTVCRYGLGLMSGQMGEAGRAVGHSGAGPGCVNAVYHYPDLAVPVTVATFTNGADEGAAEFAAVTIALRQQRFERAIQADAKHRSPGGCRTSRHLADT